MRSGRAWRGRGAHGRRRCARRPHACRGCVGRTWCVANRNGNPSVRSGARTHRARTHTHTRTRRADFCTALLPVAVRGDARPSCLTGGAFGCCLCRCCKPGRVLLRRRQAVQARDERRGMVLRPEVRGSVSPHPCGCTSLRLGWRREVHERLSSSCHQNRGDAALPASTQTACTRIPTASFQGEPAADATVADATSCATTAFATAAIAGHDAVLVAPTAMAYADEAAAAAAHASIVRWQQESNAAISAPTVAADAAALTAITICWHHFVGVASRPEFTNHRAPACQAAPARR